MNVCERELSNSESFFIPHTFIKRLSFFLIIINQKSYFSTTYDNFIEYNFSKNSAELSADEILLIVCEKFKNIHNSNWIVQNYAIFVYSFVTLSVSLHRSYC